jgi:hypothetical protein
MNNHNKNVLWAYVLKNSISLICWTIIALVFNKSWLVFFSILFLNGLEMTYEYKYFRVCDKCGKRSPYAESYNEAMSKAHDAGWVHYVDENKDYCPECKNEL